MANESGTDGREAATKAETAPAATQPYVPLMDLRARMDRLFDDMMGHWHRPFRSAGLFDPAAVPGMAAWGGDVVDVKFDVADSEEAVEISAELPGMTEDEVDLTLSDGVLTIKGEKKIEREEKEKDYVLTERQYGSFRRAFRVPESVDDSRISASFHSGVLRVTLPKRPEAKAKQKKISISTQS